MKACWAVQSHSLLAVLVPNEPRVVPGAGAEREAQAGAPEGQEDRSRCPGTAGSARGQGQSAAAARNNCQMWLSHMHSGRHMTTSDLTLDSLKTEVYPRSLVAIFTKGRRWKR